MNKFILITFLTFMTGSVFAQELSQQEQNALASFRKIYSKQIGREPSPEEEQKMLESFRSSVLKTSSMLMQMQGLSQAGPNVLTSEPATPTPSPTESPALTEDALVKKIEALGAGATKVKIEGARDGLKIGGMNYLDPEGQVKSYAFDSITGDITYSIKVGNEVIFKFMKVGIDNEPVKLASAYQSNTGWQVKTVTGKQLNGDSITPLSRGLLVSRASSTFKYEPGKGVKGIAIPEGWFMAQFQRGNVGATNFIMLERDVSSEKQGGLGALFGAVKNLGSSVGIGKKEDYALMNMVTGKLYPLNIQVDGKIQSVLSNCRKVNTFVNECATARSFESLYTTSGTRNFGHYYWKAYWYATEAGPIAVTMENGMSDVYISNLDSGKKVSAFNRTLGITSFDAEQKPDGGLSVSANWLFQEHVIDDAIKYLNENPNINTTVTQADASSK